MTRRSSGPSDPRPPTGSPSARRTNRKRPEVTGGSATGARRRRARLCFVVEYDDSITDADTIASYLDLVLDAAYESLDQCGPLVFGAVDAAWGSTECGAREPVTPDRNAPGSTSAK